MKYVIDDELKAYLPALDDETREGLEEKIQAEGCSPGALVVGQIGDEKPLVLVDGHHTYYICTEKGISLPEPRLLSFPDRAHVKAWMIKHQAARRNMTAEQRQKFAADLRANGETTRQISETLGVSQPTVTRDLKKAGDANESPAKVKGKDGKMYPAKQTPAQKAAASFLKGEREPGVEDEVADRKRERAEHRANGKPIFDDKKITEAFGKLVRLCNDRAKAYKHQKAPAYKAIEKGLDAVLTAWGAWRKA